MDSINALASNCRVATVNDPVLNSECAYTFHSPFTSKSGIVVNLKTYVGTIESLAFNNSNKTEGEVEEGLFVRIVKERVPKKVTGDAGVLRGSVVHRPASLWIRSATGSVTSYISVPGLFVPPASAAASAPMGKSSAPPKT